ncbi:MAG: hypothetical protein GY928_31220, partial [Colwellia sp.]|nr:hypothetical protein [Colwellia sp.]
MNITQDQLQEALLLLVKHYDKERKQLNEALWDTGEGHRRKPLESITVKQIKEFAFRDVKQ